MLSRTSQDQQSRELSQGNVQKRAKRLKTTQHDLKLAKLVGLDACEVREGDGLGRARMRRWGVQGWNERSDVPSGACS
jgi:hypothetical protein